MTNLIEGLGKLGAAFWEHGRALLWGCAGAALLVFGVLFGGKYFGLPNSADTFANYALWVLIAFVIFVALAIARTFDARPKKAVFFVSNEEQSIWGHSRQKTGEVLTSFSFRMAATNVSDSAVHLSKPHIVWPLNARWCEHVTAVLMTQNTSTFHASQEFAVEPHARTQITGVIALKKPVCPPGKRLTFIVSVSDHTGKRHRIKFKHVRASNAAAV
jgi:hypothetical protein